MLASSSFGVAATELEDGLARCLDAGDLAVGERGRVDPLMPPAPRSDRHADVAS